MAATPPNTNPRLKMLDPTTLPTEISPCPCNEAESVTANSGAEVPKATTVRPITISDMPNCLPMREADSTTQSAPFHKAIIERIMTTISITMSIVTPPQINVDVYRISLGNKHDRLQAKQTELSAKV